jgi:hypothetical protein
LDKVATALGDHGLVTADDIGSALGSAAAPTDQSDCRNLVNPARPTPS